MNEEAIKFMMEMYNNPLFKNGFADFFKKMQMEGIEAAKKFWTLSPASSALYPNTSEIFEKIIDFYIVLGFVPKTKYDEVVKDNEKLKTENAFLRETIKQLQLNIFKEGGKKAQEAWETVVDKQLEMNREIAKKFFGLFRELKRTGQ